jgi:hypothetical protein
LSVGALRHDGRRFVVGGGHYNPVRPNSFPHQSIAANPVEVLATAAATSSDEDSLKPWSPARQRTIKLAIGGALAVMVFAFSDLPMALTFAAGYAAALLLSR